jgi:hypothetical protein
VVTGSQFPEIPVSQDLEPLWPGYMLLWSEHRSAFRETEMKAAFAWTAIAIVGSFVLPAFTDSNPKVTKTPLSEDEKQIYRLFLNSRAKGGSVQLADRTSPLFLSEHMASCLKDIQLVNLAEAQRTVHMIGVDAISVSSYGSGSIHVAPLLGATDRAILEKWLAHEKGNR